MDPLEIIRRLETEGAQAPTDAELAKARDDIRAALDVATKADTPDLELAKALRDGLDKVVSEQTAREEAAEQNRAAARALREGLFDEDETPAETEDTDEAEADEDEEETPAVPEPTAVAASIAERLRRNIARAAPRDDVPAPVGGARLRAIGAAAGFQLADDAEIGSLGQMFATHAKSTMSGEGRLARLTRDYSDERHLGSNIEQNDRRLAGVFGYGGTSRPVTAAGGLCGPGDVDHSHPICSERGRPVRDSMPSFNASRGTVTFSPAASVGDLSDAITIWTAENDAEPTDPATKACPPVECPEELNCSIDAVVRCITVGNFQAKFSPEFWASRLELLLVDFDRAAEQKAIEEIHLASTGSGLVDEGNTLASFLVGLNHIVSADRSAHRNPTRQYTVVADAYIRDAIRNQVITNLGVANNIEALQVADAQINGWLTDIGVTPVWTLDGTFDPAGAGTHRVLTPGQIPTVGGVYVYPDDAFMFLDGGTLDLGTSITDSTLNATNDRQAFAESFEKVCFRGCSAYNFTVPIGAACGCDAGSL